MEIRLRIFSATFIAIFALLQAQTLFINWEKELKGRRSCAMSKEKSCKKQKQQSCSKSKCSVPLNNPDEEEECPLNGCNPFVPCSMGFCCYVVESFYTLSPAAVLLKQELLYFNDNRLSSSLSECWHPPELIS